MIQVGIRGTKRTQVTDQNTAKSVGSGGLPVFSTPSLVALMEGAAMEVMLPHLAPGEGSVGAGIAVRHLSATPVGMEVWCEAEVTAVDGRKVAFDIQAYDDAGLIGTATHDRVVIDNERFLQKTEGKKKKV